MNDQDPCCPHCNNPGHPVPHDGPCLSCQIKRQISQEDLDAEAYYLAREQDQDVKDYLAWYRDATRP